MVENWVESPMLLVGGFFFFFLIFRRMHAAEICHAPGFPRSTWAPCLGGRSTQPLRAGEEREEGKKRERKEQSTEGGRGRTERRGRGADAR